MGFGDTSDGPQQRIVVIVFLQFEWKTHLKASFAVFSTSAQTGPFLEHSLTQRELEFQGWSYSVSDISPRKVGRKFALASAAKNDPRATVRTWLGTQVEHEVAGDTHWHDIVVRLNRHLVDRVDTQPHQTLSFNEGPAWKFIVYGTKPSLQSSCGHLGNRVCNLRTLHDVQYVADANVTIHERFEPCVEIKKQWRTWERNRLPLCIGNGNNNEHWFEPCFNITRSNFGDWYTSW